MSKKLYEESNIKNIADAIREKNGTQNQYTVAQMPAAVRTIKTPPILEVLNVTRNGNYLPSAGKDGFSEVAVAVEGEGVIQPLNVTQNGTYNPPSGVDGYAPVMVNVSGGEPSAQSKDYAKFNGEKFIALPFTLDSDYIISVDFDALTYFTDQSVFGTSQSVNRVFLTQYDNAWYTNATGSTVSFTGSTRGRHMFTISPDGLYFDGKKKLDYKPVTDAKAILYLCGRFQGQNFSGKIYSFSITSATTGMLVARLVPKAFANIGLLYDEVSGIYYSTGIEYCDDD